MLVPDGVEWKDGAFRSICCESCGGRRLRGEEEGETVDVEVEMGVWEPVDADVEHKFVCVGEAEGEEEDVAVKPEEGSGGKGDEEEEQEEEEEERDDYWWLERSEPEQEEDYDDFQVPGNMAAGRRASIAIAAAAGICAAHLA
jgi:hypothetical protein